MASFDLGASLGVPFLTAHRALTVTEEARCASARGLCRAAPSWSPAVPAPSAMPRSSSPAGPTRLVITTVSSPLKANLAARAGADHVIDYTQQDVVAEVRAIAPDGVNTIVEVAPAANAAIDAEVMGLHGSVAVYATTGARHCSCPCAR